MSGKAPELQNPGIEPPIYIESFSEQRRHRYTATAGDAVHRYHVRLEEIWNAADRIPDYAPPPNTPELWTSVVQQMVNDGDESGPPLDGPPPILTLRKNKPLTAIPGTFKFEVQGPQPIRQVVTATFGQPAPLAASCAPIVAATAAPTAVQGYTPVIRDATGAVHAMSAAVWVVDGLNGYVEFPYGIPSEMVPPFELTYFEYTGAYGGTGTVSPDDPHIWRYTADSAPPFHTLCPDPLAPTAQSPSHFVAPLPAQSTEGSGTRLMLDHALAAIRAGSVDGVQWDVASRGLYSAAFGRNCTASGRSAAICGGEENVAAGSYTFAGGLASTATQDHTFVWSGSTPQASTAADEVTFGATGGFRVFGAGAAGAPAYAGGEIYLDAASTVVTGKLTVSGLIDPTGIQCDTQATNPGTVAAGLGTFWARSGSPCVPVFTDNAGVDSVLTVSTFENASGVTRLDAAAPGYALTNDFVFGSLQLDSGSSANRFMFDTAQASFRAGSADGVQWDVASRGLYSTAFGRNCTASGGYTFAGGLASTATQDHTFVWSGSTPQASTAADEVTFGATGGFRVFGAGAAGAPAYAGGEIYLDAASTVVTGKLTVSGLIDPTGIQCDTQATNPGAVAAGLGTFWARSGSPCVPVFTDNAGVDSVLTVSTFENASGVTRLDAAAPGYALTNDFVFGSLQLDSGSSANRFMFDTARGTFHAGSASGAQWDSRGTHCAVFGQDSSAAAGTAAALVSGVNNSISSAGAGHAICGGSTNAIQSSVGVGNAIIGGASNTIVSGATIRRSAIVGASFCALGGGPETADFVMLGGSNHSTLSGKQSAILAGTVNACNGTSSVCIGGSFNTVSGTGCAAIACTSTEVSGLNSVAIAGDTCVVTGNGTFCGGSSAVDGGHNGSFVWSDSTNATNATAPNTFVVGVAGGATFWSNSSRTVGVTLAADGNAWASASDRNIKENFVQLQDVEVLSRVDRLPIYEYNLKGQAADQVYRGPVAQDWHELFPSGKDPLRIDTMDLDGVALAAIRGLSVQVRALQTDNIALRARVERLEALEERVGRIEALAQMA